MTDKRLMERLKSKDGTRRNYQSNIFELTQSVKGYLFRLLNTRQGSAAVQDFGVPDISDLPGGFATPETRLISRLISSAIEKYEPRLQDVDVSFTGAGKKNLTLCFELKGTMMCNGQKTALIFRTDLGSNGMFTIEEKEA